MKKTSNLSGLVRWWDVPAGLLLLAALIIAATRLSATQWTEDLALVRRVAVFGAMAGLALGQSRFAPSTARFFATAYGLFTIPWQLGLTLGKGVLWSERMISLGNRMLVTIDQLIGRKPVSDNLFFLCLMATLFWAISAYAGYSLTRYAHAWRAILPAGLTTVIIHTYDPYIPIRAWFLAAYIFFSLLLLARMNFVHQYQRWKESHAYLPPYLGVDFVRMALLVTAILVLFSWTAPALATALPAAEKVWQPVEFRWNKVRDRLSNAFSALQASVGIVTDLYGETLELGRGNPLSDAVVMNIQAPPHLAAGVRYYWRARVYDHFDGRWQSTLPTTRSLTPDRFDLDVPEYEGRTTETFLFKTLYPILNLYTPPQPLWVSRPVEATLAINPDASVDLGFLEAKPYLRGGEIYKVEASLSAPTIAQLRAAGTDYPSWVADRYLQLPESITARTYRLAKDITADLETPYDKVEAITIFLRNHLEYSETIPLPPDGKEPIDWVLFSYRKAFCNYYATAEIVLLRSLGIPARLAVGYAEGERQIELDYLSTPMPGEITPGESEADSNMYAVRHRDAHAWPEVFFPGLGWVEFEPTASQQSIIRPADNQPDDAANADDLRGGGPDRPDFSNMRSDLQDRGAGLFDEENTFLGSGVKPVYWGIGSTLILTLSTLLVWRVRKVRGSPPLPVQLESGLRRLGLPSPKSLRRWARYASLSILGRAYLEINRALARLGVRPHPTDTPAERATSLSRLIPSAAVSIHDLVAAYQFATYGPQPGDDPAARLIGNAIRRQSYLALVRRWFARLQEPL